MIAIALFVGLVAGYFFYRYFDLTPGGIVTPGYFALFIAEPVRIGMTFGIALIIWVVLQFLSAHLILFGKRKFMLSLVLGILATLVINPLAAALATDVAGLAVIGFIVPGLLAHDMSRQSPLKSFVACGSVTTIVYLIMLLLQ